MLGITHSLFWGSIVILIGVIVILKIFPVFKNISAGRIVGGIILVYLGISIIFGSRFFYFKDDFRPDFMRNKRGFNDNYSYKDSRKDARENYDIAFGSEQIDLRSMPEGSEKKLKINVAFGSAEIRLKKKTKVSISGNVAFGSINLPGGVSKYFGRYDMIFDEPSEVKSHVDIYSNVSFGSLNIRIEE